MKSTTGLVFKLGNKRISSADIRVHFEKDWSGLKAMMKNPFVGPGVH